MSVDIDMPSKQYQICQKCSAEAGKKCKLAQLQKSLLRKPLTTDANKNNVNVTNIPENCPNRYISMDSQPLTKD
jgi:hypothetical protein